MDASNAIASAIGFSIPVTTLFFPLAYFAARKQMRLRGISGAWLPYLTSLVVIAANVMLFGEPKVDLTKESPLEFILFFFVPIFLVPPAICLAVLYFTYRETTIASSITPAGRAKMAADAADHTTTASQHEVELTEKKEPPAIFATHSIGRDIKRTLFLCGAMLVLVVAVLKVADDLPSAGYPKVTASLYQTKVIPDATLAQGQFDPSTAVAVVPQTQPQSGGTFDPQRALNDYYVQQKDADDQNTLGLMYFIGQGVPQDYKLAAYWYEKAAAQGAPYGQHNLGALYSSGQGVPQDYKLAAYWYEKAATQGDALSQYKMGIIYFNGLGVQQDYIEAHKWFNLAGANGNAEAIKSRGSIEVSMNREQTAEAQRRASEWLNAHPK